MLTIGSWVRVKSAGCRVIGCPSCGSPDDLSEHQSWDGRVGRLVKDWGEEQNRCHKAVCPKCGYSEYALDFFNRTGHIYGVDIDGFGCLFSREELELLGGDGSLSAVVADALTLVEVAA